MITVPTHDSPAGIAILVIAAILFLGAVIMAVHGFGEKDLFCPACGRRVNSLYQSRCPRCGKHLK